MFLCTRTNCTWYQVQIATKSMQRKGKLYLGRGTFVVLLEKNKSLYSYSSIKIAFLFLHIMYIQNHNETPKNRYIITKRLQDLVFNFRGFSLKHCFVAVIKDHSKYWKVLFFTGSSSSDSFWKQSP